MWKLLLVFFLSGCFIEIVENKVNNEVVESCKNFCDGNKYDVVYRNEYSYFCSCFKDNKPLSSIVIGSKGTIYK